MKKLTLFIATLSTLALASCADSDEPGSGATRQAIDDGIAFRSGLASRATETTNANLSSFDVTAFAGNDIYFQDETFTKGSDSYFTSPKHFEWLDNNEKIKFYAYSPSIDQLGGEIEQVADTANLTLQDFMVADNIADQVDFITASATGNRKENQATGVELTFDHRLSQVEIQAMSENPTYDIKAIGARIGRVEYMGTFDFASSTWTLDEWHDTAVYDTSCDTITLGATPQSLMGPAGNAMLMPQTHYYWDPVGDPDNAARQSYLSVLVQITRKDNGYRVYPFPDDTKIDPATGKLRDYAWASIPLSVNWEQGKKYIYTLDFTLGGGNVDPDDPTPGDPVISGDIKFKVTVDDWTSAPSSIPMTPIVKKS